MTSFVENGHSKRLSIPRQSFAICAKTENKIYKFDWKRNRRNFGRIKAQFELVTRDDEAQYLQHYFNQRDPAVFNINNEEGVNATFNHFIDEVKGEIEAWSQGGSGWVREKSLAVFSDVARYDESFRGGSCMSLSEKLQNKKAIINIQNRDNQCLRLSFSTALFPAPRGKNPVRTGSHPTEDGLNFTGIDFPTTVSQIDKLEKQYPNLAIYVFSWEKEHVFVHRISEKDGAIPRINLILAKQSENTHYSYVKRLNALLFDQNKYKERKHFCERCL